MPYFETSAKLNKNVDELISHMMEQVYEKMFTGEGGRDTNTVVIKNTKKGEEQQHTKDKKGGCC